MQSNNPIFRRSEEFNQSANAYGNQTYAGGGPTVGFGRRPGRDRSPGTHVGPR